MARLKRLVVPRVPHHVSQRVVAGGVAFVDASDRQAFVSALRSCSAEHGVAVLAYALLDHQVQLMLIPDRAESLGRMMQSLTRQYVGPFNRKHARTGALWQSRFSSAPVQSATHLLNCVIYVEQAPQRAGFQGAAFEYPWSSACHHAGLCSVGWLAAMPADSAYWKLGNTPFERDAAYRRLLELALPAADIQKIESTVFKGWALGSDPFLADIGASMGRRSAPAPRGRPPLGRR
ncbi:MAG: transposase [Burkholderiaceae bacterium]|nr:transposase [Burkholderiaceae bacterium]